MSDNKLVEGIDSVSLDGAKPDVAEVRRRSEEYKVRGVSVFM